MEKPVLLAPTLFESHLQADPVWQRAKDVFETECRRLKGKDYEEIQSADGPQDLISFIERINNAQGTYAKTVNVTNKCVAFLTEHEDAIGVLFQAGGGPGSLAWGCIKLALHMVRSYTGEYIKLLGALESICEWLQPIKVESETFANWPNVQGSLLKLYGLILRFWERGILAYSENQKKLRRTFRCLRSTWSNLDAELSDLKRDFEDQIRKFQANVAAAHNQETKQGQSELRSGVDKISYNAHVGEISTLLGPPRDAGYGSDFYEADLEELYSRRYADTCEWMFERPEYSHWMRARATDPMPALLITSGPGGGKSVLIANMIKTLQATYERDPQRPVFYFFFDNSDANKNCALAAAKSILYQASTYGRLSEGEGFHALETRLGTAAVENSKKPSVIWKLLLGYLTLIPAAILVLDALDECNDISQLLDRILEPELRKSARLLLSGRQNIATQCNDAKSLCNLEIGVEEASRDIRAYLGSKKEGAFCPELHERTVNAIVEKSEGMFLWANLVSQDMESVYPTNFEAAIRALPQDLNSAYDKTLTRILTELRNKSQLLDICLKTLQWLSCSLRPLRMDELLSVLQKQSSSDEYWLKENSVKSACGPLVNIRKGRIQLIHFSTREYLTGPYLANLARPKLRQFYVDSRRTHVSIATASLNYIQAPKVKELLPLGRESYEESMTRTGGSSCLATASLQRIAWAGRVKTLLPFVEYAVRYWIQHLHFSTYPWDARDDLSTTASFLKSDDTLLWLELYFTLNPDDADLMRLTFEFRQSPEIGVGTPASLQSSWVRAVLNLLEEFGASLLWNPNEARHIDLSVLKNYDEALLKWSSAKTCKRQRPKIVEFRAPKRSDENEKPPSTDRRCQLSRNPGEIGRVVKFLEYHQESGMLIFADKEVPAGIRAYLYCQRAESGHPETPFEIRAPSTEPHTLRAGVTNKHMTDLCLQYEEEAGASSVFVVKLTLSEEERGPRHWATLVRVIEVGKPALGGNLFLANGRLYTAENVYDLQTGDLMKIRQEELTAGTTSMIRDATVAVHHYANGVPLRRYRDLSGIDPKSGGTYVHDFQGKQMRLPPGGPVLGLTDNGRYFLFIRRGHYRRLFEHEIPDQITIYDRSTGTSDCVLTDGLYKHHIFYADNEWLLCVTSSQLIRYHVASMTSQLGRQHDAVSMDVRNLAVEAIFVNVGKKEVYASAQGKLGWINVADMKWMEYPFEKPWGILVDGGHIIEEDLAEFNYQISSNGRELAIFTHGLYYPDDPIERKFTMRTFDLVSGSLTRKHVLPDELAPICLSHEWRTEVSSDLRILWITRALIRQTTTQDGDALEYLAFTGWYTSWHQPQFGAFGNYFAVCTDPSYGRSSRSLQFCIDLYETDGMRNTDEEFEPRRISVPLLRCGDINIRFHPNGLLLAILISGFVDPTNVLREENFSNPTPMASTQVHLHDIRTAETVLIWADNNIQPSSEWIPMSERTKYSARHSLFSENVTMLVDEDGVSINPFNRGRITIWSDRMPLPPSTHPSFPRTIQVLHPRKARFPEETTEECLYYNDYKLTLKDASRPWFQRNKDRPPPSPQGVVLHIQRSPPSTHTPTFTRGALTLDLAASCAPGTTARFRPDSADIAYYPIMVLPQSQMREWYKGYLLLGAAPEDNMRILFIWYYGNRRPEIHFLDFSWRDMMGDVDAYYEGWDRRGVGERERGKGVVEEIPRRWGRRGKGLGMGMGGLGKEVKG